jgi:hypothetical protein
MAERGKGRRMPGWLVVIPAVIVGGCGVMAYRQYELEWSAKRPVEVIRAELLAATPLGSDILEVQDYIERRWGTKEIRSYESGGFHLVVTYGHYSGKRPLWGPLVLVIFPLGTAVYANWEFDPIGKLKDVTVKKVEDTI